jgi:hypothetical protein
MPTTVLASLVTPTAQYRRQQLMSFLGNSRNSNQNSEKFVKKDKKRVKIPHF